MATEAGEDHPQEAIDAAAPGETVVVDGSVTHALEEPLTITTPGLTVRGCDLRLADGAGENLVEIGADGVRFTDFVLDGNRETQAGERHSNGVLVTGASNVAIAGGRVANVSRHGIRVVDTGTVTSVAPGNTVTVERGAVSDVAVRDVRVERPRRDGCSVEGPDLESVSVGNVRTVDSTDRGAVEIKDGVTDAHVANCRAENCVYGVAVQDHGEYSTANVRVVGNAARDCETLIDAQTSHPPNSVTLVGNVGRDLGGDGMGGPGGIHAHLIRGLVVANNVLDGVDGPGIVVDDCEDVTVTGNAVRGTEGPGVSVGATDGVGVQNNTLDGTGPTGIECRGSDGGTADLHVSDNRCSSGGVTVEGEADRYLVTGNLLGGPVEVDTTGDGRVSGNLE